MNGFFLTPKKLVTINITNTFALLKNNGSWRIITFEGEKEYILLFDISMYYGISSTSAFKSHRLFFSRISHSFLKGLFVFVACPVLATRKAPRFQRFDCPQDLFSSSPILYSKHFHTYICTERQRGWRACAEVMGWDYHCNGVVSTLDSDRFSGAKAHVCI